MVSIPARSAAALWPPDDTEESILGVDRHQLDKCNLRFGINELGGSAADGGPLPWQAITQIMVLGCRHPDGSAYTVYPDVAVFAHPLDRDRGSFSLQRDGAPVLVVEVATPTTVEADLDVQAGKGWSYAHAGVAEYLVLDPSGEMLPEAGQGWRLEGGVYRPWQKDESGRWRSEEIGASLGVEGGLAAVYDRAGRRQLREGEVTGAIAALDARAREERDLGERAGLDQGLVDGRRQGLIEGKRVAVRLLAQERFGQLPWLEARIDSASEADLDVLVVRLATVTSAEDL